MHNDLTKPRRSVNVLAAYRQDLSSRGNTPLGDHDGVWLQFGSLLAHSGAFDGEARERALRQATLLARGMLSIAAWEEGNRFDPERPTEPDTLQSRIRTIAETIEMAGAMRLADAILEAYLLSHPDCGALEQGRIEAERARIAWKTGEIEIAEQRYARTLAAARKANSEELHVRALIGQALLARLAGNYPKSASRARAALRLAKQGNLRRLAASAQHTVMVAAAVRGELAAALAHGWSAFLHASGDPILETDVLGNVGQVFLDMGHPATAIAAFRVVISRRPSSRVLLPALGGYAIAASRLEDRTALDAVASNVIELSKVAGTPYAVAVAYLEIAEAYALLNESSISATYRNQALAIAQEKRYHELVHRAESATVAPRPSARPLKPETERIAGAVRELALA